VLGEPLGGVLARYAQLVGEHFGRSRRRRQPGDRARAVLGLPHRSQACHGRRLARAGRADQYVKDPARTGDLLHGQGLVDRKGVVPPGQALLGYSGDGGDRDRRPVSATAGAEQAFLGFEESFRGVDLRDPEHGTSSSRRPGGTPRGRGGARGR
jgi:hypothetical protein